MIYYVTSSANMPAGAGYFQVHADTAEEARKKAFEQMPEGRWCFMYRSLNEVHPLDRKCLGEIK